MERLHILDGYGYIFRAYFGLAGPGRGGVRLTTSAGMPTGALYVYAQMLVRLHLDVKPDRIVVVFDAPGKSFRHDLDPEYKATRSETPEDLKVQMPYFKPLTEAFSWPVIAVPGVEADDTIATLVMAARHKGWDVTIYSADKDLMQLVDDHVAVIDSMRQKTYDRAAVEAKFGVGPDKVADWLALVGDKSDNVPGMQGVGKVTASKLLNQYGTIDGILEHTSELKGKMRERFEDQAQLEQLGRSRELVALKLDVEVGRGLDSFRPATWDGGRLREVLQELEFHALLERLDPKAAQDSPAARFEIGPESIIASSWEEVGPVLAAIADNKRMAIEIETDGGRADRAYLIGIALATEGVAPIYLPFAHRYLSAPPQLDLDAAPQAFRDILADSQVEVVCHDAKAVERALLRVGFALSGVVCDTMLAAYLLDPSAEFSLEEIARSTLRVELESRKALVGSGKSAVAFEAVPVERAATRAGRAATAIYQASELLSRRIELTGNQSLLRDIELPLASLLGRVEQKGITLDVAFLRGLADKVGARIADIERNVYELAGEQINIGSPKQLAALLYDKFGLVPVIKKKRQHGYSTDAETLESLRGAHPIIAPILEYRELVKLKGTYIDALPPLVNPNTGRLHTSFRQAVAATGRLSSQDPNLQNIPIRTELGKEIREAFVASPGMVLVSADYSQIELRIMAHMSGDPVLSRAFSDDVDVHTQTAAEVFGMSLDDVTSAERRVAKAVNYGLIYGQGDWGLARSLHIPVAQAKGYIETYFERFSTVRTFMNDVVDKARKAGAAETLLGRRRPIPDISHKAHHRRAAAERIAQNMPMQGTAADILKLAMLAVDRYMENLDYAASMLLTVHDELVFEVAKDHATQFGAAVAREMEGAYKLNVPLKVDVGIGANWAEAH